MRYYILDLFRFFAALIVVMYHYIPLLDSERFFVLQEISQFGYLGVPFFFILSGFVISLSANNRSALTFSVSRLVRLYPAYWTSVTITAIIVIIFTGSNLNFFEYIANLTMLNDYVGIENVDGVYWTLQQELKFYGCIFLLLVFGLFQHFKIWLSIWLGMTFTHLLTSQPFFMGWLISPGYSSFFMAGVVFYIVSRDGFTWFTSFVLLILLIVSSISGFKMVSGFIVDPTLDERIIVVIAIWSFYLLFLLMCQKKINVGKRKIYVTMGAITYPLYLIHNIAGKAIINYYKSSIPVEILVTVVTILMLFIAYSITSYIEKPLSALLKNVLHVITSKKLFFKLSIPKAIRYRTIQGE